MRFGSVCSGIEAASVAFRPLGWRAAWLSEIEPFPCAVLEHHYPGVPNLGDMTLIADRIDAGEIEAPDMLCGGCPCQSFSVAGLRKSLSDERGNLTLEFIRIADAIDRVRRNHGKPPAWVLYENVPGILSTQDNAFGALLGGLCGGDAAIDAPAAGWPSAGVVAGPARVVAWRVLDAQFFGLAQRRKRVFVLALGGAGGWACADALLPVIDSLSGHPAPSREAGAGVAASLTSSLGRRGGVPDGGDTEGQLIPAASMCLNAKGGAGRLDAESETLIPTIGGVFDVAHSLRGEGFDASEDGTGMGTPLVPVVNGGSHVSTRSVVPGTAVDTTHPVGAGHQGRLPHAHAFDARQSDVIQYGDKTGPLDTDGSTIGVLAFSCKDHGADASADLAPTLRAMGHAGSHANAGGQMAVAFQERGRDGGRSLEVGGEVAFALTAPNGGGRAQERNIAQGMSVRRLTPRECARLQGFPDDYLDITFRGKPAADGNKYRALGNSWATPVVRWIGERIEAVEAIKQQREAA